MNWPELPNTGFITGRIARKKDLRKKNAAFALGLMGLLNKSKPLEIDIPQYAYHIDDETGEKTPCFIIQGEEFSTHKIIGYKLLDNDELGAALMEEFIFLGREKPHEEIVDISN